MKGLEKQTTSRLQILVLNINLKHPVLLVLPAESFLAKTEAQFLWKFARFWHFREVASCPTKPNKIKIVTYKQVIKLVSLHI
jgi:hypothetical protein